MVRLIVMFVGWMALAWAMEVVDATGRVDLQRPGSLDWAPLVPGGQVGNNEVYRVQARSRLLLRDSLGLELALHGPGQMRVNQILNPQGGAPSQILGELRGLFRVRWNGVGLAPDRFICNNVTLHSFRGPGRFFCAEDSLTLIVWMEQGGQMTAQRGEAYSVRVEPGRVWRMRTIEGKTEDQFVDSVWASAYLRDRFGEAAPQMRKVGRVRLLWEPEAPVPEGTNWRLGEYLAPTLRDMPGLVVTEDSLPWTVQGRIEQFQVQQGEGFWNLDLRIRFILQNRDMPLQNREVLFEKHEPVTDVAPDRLGLLRLLPLDVKNTRIQRGRFGALAKELEAFVAREVVDPFQREGFAAPVP